MKDHLLSVLKIRSEDRKIYIITAFVAVLLTCKEYFGKASIFKSWQFENLSSWKKDVAAFFFEGESSSLHSLIFWAASCVLFYLVIPMFVRRILFPDESSLFQWKLPKSHWMIYGGMLIFMILPLIGTSYLNSFQQTYPFVYIPKGEHFGRTLLLWELAYFFQFVAVEYFFRGFILFSFEKYLGNKAVLVPLLPYVMIHFGKPFPETIGAIVAGLVLGTIALRSRSILPGILVHFSIAIGMDILSLWQQKYF